jgi:hypothetical protein
VRVDMPFRWFRRSRVRDRDFAAEFEREGSAGGTTGPHSGFQLARLRW